MFRIPQPAPAPLHLPLQPIHLLVCLAAQRPMPVHLLPQLQHFTVLPKRVGVHPDPDAQPGVGQLLGAQLLPARLQDPNALLLIGLDVGVVAGVQRAQCLQGRSMGRTPVAHRAPVHRRPVPQRVHQQGLVLHHLTQLPLVQIQKSDLVPRVERQKLILVRQRLHPLQLLHILLVHCHVLDLHILAFNIVASGVCAKLLQVVL